MRREGLYKALSKGENSMFYTVMRITRVLGMQLRVTVKCFIGIEIDRKHPITWLDRRA